MAHLSWAQPRNKGEDPGAYAMVVCVAVTGARLDYRQQLV